VIHLAVGFHHYQTGNKAGAARQLRKACENSRAICPPAGASTRGGCIANHSRASIGSSAAAGAGASQDRLAEPARLLESRQPR
jgi:hypothetical protein